MHCMSLRNVFFTIAAAALTVSAPADALRNSDQKNAREQKKAGKVLALRQIETRVLPRMKGMQYLGPEYDSTAQVYRLKFIQKDRVIFVDVDARSGRMLKRR